MFMLLRHYGVSDVTRFISASSLGLRVGFIWALVILVLDGGFLISGLCYIISAVMCESTGHGIFSIGCRK